MNARHTLRSCAVTWMQRHTEDTLKFCELGRALQVELEGRTGHSMGESTN